MYSEKISKKGKSYIYAIVDLKEKYACYDFKSYVEIIINSYIRISITLDSQCNQFYNELHLVGVVITKFK